MVFKHPLPTPNGKGSHLVRLILGSLNQVILLSPHHPQSNETNLQKKSKILQTASIKIKFLITAWFLSLLPQILINSNSKLCNYNTSAEIQIIWCPRGEQVRMWLRLHSALSESRETTQWPGAHLPQTQAVPLPSSLARRQGQSWQLASRPFNASLRGAGTGSGMPSYFWPGTATHRTFWSLHLVSGLSGRWYTCRMWIDVAMEIEQLFPALSESISLCNEAAVRRRERPAPGRKWAQGGTLPSLTAVEKPRWLFLNAQALLPLFGMF